MIPHGHLCAGGEGGGRQALSLIHFLSRVVVCGESGGRARDRVGRVLGPGSWVGCRVEKSIQFKTVVGRKMP